MSAMRRMAVVAKVIAASQKRTSRDTLKVAVAPTADLRSERLMNQNGDPGPADANPGVLSASFICKYASDAIMFLDYRDAYRRPAWMDAPRGPDVSPELR